MRIDEPVGTSGLGSAKAEAFAELDSICRNHANKIYLAARRITNATDAEDALQDAFEAYLRLRSDAEVRDPLPWLCTVAQRRALRSRDQNLTSSADESTWFLEQIPSASGLPEQSALREGWWDQLLHSLLGPADSTDRGFHWNYFELMADGYSVAEIAVMSETSPREVSDEVQRMRMYLRGRVLDARDRAAVPERINEDSVGDKNAEQSKLMDAVGKLPTRQRQVLGWAMDGSRPKAIAKLLGITGNAARASLHYAKQAVAKEVGCDISDVLPALKTATQVVISLAG